MKFIAYFVLVVLLGSCYSTNRTFTSLNPSKKQIEVENLVLKASSQNDRWSMINVGAKSLADANMGVEFSGSYYVRNLNGINLKSSVGYRNYMMSEAPTNAKPFHPFFGNVQCSYPFHVREKRAKILISLMQKGGIRDGSYYTILNDQPYFTSWEIVGGLNWVPTIHTSFSIRDQLKYNNEYIDFILPNGGVPDVMQYRGYANIGIARTKYINSYFFARNGETSYKGSKREFLTYYFNLHANLISVVNPVYMEYVAGESSSEATKYSEDLRPEDYLNKKNIGFSTGIEFNYLSFGRGGTGLQVGGELGTMPGVYDDKLKRRIYFKFGLGISIASPRN